jgi:ribonuclease HII
MTTRRRPTRRPGRRLLNHDRKLGVRFVAGADEVGRGCLAGPLVTAAVVFDYATLTGPAAAPLGHLDDSKKLTAAAREKLYDAVVALAAGWSVISISPATIDRRGLHVSNLAGLRRALDTVRTPADISLVDGFQLDGCTRIIKGDATSAAIAAASILAKVTRDRLMTRLEQVHGNRWAFDEHVGYATPLHHERIAVHGVSPLHRMSFDSIAYRSEGVGDVVDAVDSAVALAVHQEHVEPVLLNASL